MACELYLKKAFFFTRKDTVEWGPSAWCMQRAQHVASMALARTPAPRVLTGSPELSLRLPDLASPICGFNHPISEGGHADKLTACWAWHRQAPTKVSIMLVNRAKAENPDGQKGLNLMMFLCY